MEAIECAKCSVEMDLAWQGEVYGDQQTLRYHCSTCGGVVNLQKKGRQYQQVRLDGNHHEYRPRAFQAEDKVELEHQAAFMVGRTLTQAEQEQRARMWAQQQAARQQAGLGQQQQDVMARAQAMAQAAMAAQQQQLQARHYAAYMAYCRQLQARGLPIPVQQPVAFTLGQHPTPILPMHPAELRRRMLGGGGA